MYQELDVVDGLTIAENIFLGHELARGGVLHASAREAARQTRELLRAARPRRPLAAHARSGTLSAPPTSRSSAWRAPSRTTSSSSSWTSRRAVLDTEEVKNLFHVVQELTSAGHRRRLHHAPPRGDPADRRPHHRPQGRPQHGDRPPGRRHPDAGAHPADDRPRGRERLPAAPCPCPADAPVVLEVEGLGLRRRLRRRLVHRARGRGRRSRRAWSDRVAPRSSRPSTARARPTAGTVSRRRQDAAPRLGRLGGRRRHRPLARGAQEPGPACSTSRSS